MDCKVYDLDLIDYQESFVLQKSLHKERQGNLITDTLLVCEHPAVITLGRLASQDNILVNNEYLKQRNIEVINVDRGGDVTMHMPGQLIAYPIFDLNQHGKDIHIFVRKLEETVLIFLSYFGITGQRIDGLTGVWAGDKKIGSIGIAISRWISYHGLSININCDWELFSFVRPCGFPVDKFTDLCSVLNKHISMQAAKASLYEAFRQVFCCNLFNVKYAIEKQVRQKEKILT